MSRRRHFPTLTDWLFEVPMANGKFVIYARLATLQQHEYPNRRHPVLLTGDRQPLDHSAGKFPPDRFGPFCAPPCTPLPARRRHPRGTKAHYESLTHPFGAIWRISATADFLLTYIGHNVGHFRSPDKELVIISAIIMLEIRKDILYFPRGSLCLTCRTSLPVTSSSDP